MRGKFPVFTTDLKEKPPGMEQMPTGVSQAIFKKYRHIIGTFWKRKCPWSESRGIS
jgi:hypothetical protein